MKQVCRIFAMLAAITFLILSPAISQHCCAKTGFFSDKSNYCYSDGFTDFEVQVNGDIHVTDDDTGIKSISPGGYIKIEKKTFGNKRSLNIESNSSGVISYQYYEGRSEVPFEPEGKKWLSEILLDIIRLTGIDAEERTKRIYSKKGIEGVIEEIKLIPSNSVMSLYYDAALKNFDLSDAELVKICISIPSQMSSNSEMGSLFRKYSDKFTRNNTTSISFFTNISRLTSNTERGSILSGITTKIDFTDPTVTDAYFGGLDKMTSNTEIGSILRSLERKQTLDNASYTRLLMSVQKMTSNTEMGSILRSLKNFDINNQNVSVALFNSIDKLTSNTEASQTLQHLIRNFELSEENYIRLLGSTKKLVSNTEIGAVMRSIKKINLSNSNINEAYFLVIGSLVSNTEAGSVLRYTLNNHSFNSATWISLLKATSVLTSNTEMGSVLSGAILKMPWDIEMVADAFFNTVNKFTSNTEHGRVLRDAISSPGFNKYAAYKLLESAAKLVSNTEKSAVLVRLSQTPFIKDPEIKKLYLSTARTITSDSEYRRVTDNLLE